MTFALVQPEGLRVSLVVEVNTAIWDDLLCNPLLLRG